MQARAYGPIRRARFQEESLPQADLTATATPTPTPEPGSETSSTPTDTPSPPPTTSEVFPEPTVQPTSADQLPPLQPGSMALSLRVSDSSLQDIIDKEQSPARAASMRIAEQARTELLGGHPDEASRDLARAVSIDPSDPYAYFYLGRAYIVKKNYSQAMTFLKRAEIGFGSRNPLWLSETLGFEGQTYEESGHDTAAAAAYQQALQVNPGNLMARVGYSRLAPSEGAPAAGADAPPPAGEPIPGPPASSPPPPPPDSPPPADQ
ncbi:MAG: tetratricopeptide repeat protein [Deltaproteobacteria bacterium]|nr:tetratricopeptide repeat protein [Deltaproteobacteria bacterium]